MSRDRNIAVTSGIITHHLFEKLLDKRRGGVMYSLDKIASEVLDFIEKHQEIEENNQWEEFTNERGYDDWESYCVDTISKRLKL